MPMETGRDMEQAASFQASETDPNKEKVQGKYKAFLKKWVAFIALLASSMGVEAYAQNPNLPNQPDTTKISTANTGSATSRIPTKVFLGQSQNQATAEIKPVEVDFSQYQYKKTAPVQPTQVVEVDLRQHPVTAPEQTILHAEEVDLGQPKAKEPAVLHAEKVGLLGRPDAAPVPPPTPVVEVDLRQHPVTAPEQTILHVEKVDLSRPDAAKQLFNEQDESK